MATNRYMFYPDTKKAILDYACEESIDPERRVYQLRRISYRANEQANRITNTGGVNESQSRTDIGADSDTPKACLAGNHYENEEGRAFDFCPDCGKRLSS